MSKLTYDELVELATSQKDKKSRLKGSLDTLGKSLKDMGFKSPSDAKAKIKGLEKEIDLLKEKEEKLLREFQDKYAQYL